jgi:hypothetical protein
MRKSLSCLLVSAMMVAVLAGCSTASENSSTTSSTPSAPSAATAPVSLSMTDDAPAGVSVLFFQVSLTGATLTPSSGSAVSLLSNNTPIQIDVTQLQALSAFLNTADLTAGTYNSLSLTFASPQIVIFNGSDTALGSTCAVGSVCQIAPTIDNSATVGFSSAPFPLTVAANAPLGLLIDFHLNTVVQSDLSVNLGVSNGVTISELPATLPSHPQFGFLTGAVQSVNAGKNQFTLQTRWGRTFTIDSGNNTAYDDFPSSACKTAGIACLADGQIVQVQISNVASGGVLQAAQVTYVQTSSQQTAQGTIIGLENSNSGTIMKLILHNNPSNNSGLALGGVAAVSIAGNASFSVDANGFTLPSGLSFTGASGLFKGQQVQVDVVKGSMSTSSGPGNGGGWGPPRSVSFTTDSVELEPSQVTGTISALDSGADSFTLGSNGGRFFVPWPMAAAANNTLSFNVLTTTQTSYQGFSPESFDGLAANNLVSVSGWLFPPASSTGPPTLAAQAVVMRQKGMF